MDACLGQSTSVGCIQVVEGPLRPGAGVNKQLPPVGDIHLTGIVNVGGFMEYFVLQNTRLSLVMRLSDIISSSLYSALKQWNLHSRSAATREQ
ncbi:spore protease YyaC [Paenibacillus rhizoplanae]